MGFLDGIVGGTTTPTDPNAKYTFGHDKWDANASKKIYKEVKNYRAATEKLKDVAETGYEAMIDAFFGFFKSQPRLKDRKAVRPSWRVNHVVMEAMMDLPEYKKVHGSTSSDPLNAAFACVDIAPVLATIFDRLKVEQERAQRIEEMIARGEAASQELSETQEALSGDDLSESDAAALSERAEALREEMRGLSQSIEEESQALEDAADNVVAGATKDIRDALKEVSKDIETTDSFMSWGLNQGTLTRMSPNERIELADKLRSDKFRQLARLAGRMQSLAYQKQLQRAAQTPDEIYDIETGDDLHRVLPSEYLNLVHPVTKRDFFRRFLEKELAQYSLKGNDELHSGPIIFIEDGSSSMEMGGAHIMAKAIGLALLKIAFMQNRGFYAIQFGGSGHIVNFDFDTESSLLGLEIEHGNNKESFTGTQAIVAFADKFIRSGGTDFLTPLEQALEVMEKEYDQFGRTRSDIVFVTDGQSYVPETFIEKFKEAQERLGFNIYCIGTGAMFQMEPMNTICDGNVTMSPELLESRSEDIGNIFGAI